MNTAAKDYLLTIMRDQGITQDDLLRYRIKCTNEEDRQWRQWITNFLNGTSRLEDATFAEVKRLANLTGTSMGVWLRRLPPHFPLKRSR